MSYTTRELPVSEWPRLAGTEAEAVWPLLNPATDGVIVVEHDGVIVGCWTHFLMRHVECLWMAPEARQTATVPRRLWVGMRQALRVRGVRRVMTAALTDGVRRLLTKVGATQIPGDHYVMEI